MSKEVSLVRNNACIRRTADISDFSLCYVKRRFLFYILGIFSLTSIINSHLFHISTACFMRPKPQIKVIFRVSSCFIVFFKKLKLIKIQIKSIFKSLLLNNWFTFPL